MTIQQAFELAVQHHQSGRLAEAEAIYRQILAVEPQHADSLHLLGVLAHQVGQNEVAVDLIGQAIVLDPNFPEAHSNFGNALKGMGRLDEAITAYRQAIALKHGYPDAHYNLGNALKEKGQLDEAIAAYRQAVALNANFPEAHSNLGVAFLGKGQADEAITACHQAIGLKPDLAEAHCNLGNALRDKGQLDEAIAAHRQAIRLKPAWAEAHSNLGGALQDKGQLYEAVTACRQAIELKPAYPEAHSNLGGALRGLGQLDEAIASYRQAIALKPDLAETHSNLGVALQDRGQLDEAIASYRQAIALKPNDAEAHSNLGGALRSTGQIDEAITSLGRAIALQPAESKVASYLLLTLNCHSGIHAGVIAEEHRGWNERHAVPLRKHLQSNANDRSPDRRLRIGYVSPDFREHPVGRFLLPLLANHDRERFEVFAYAQVLALDGMTQRLRTHTDVWRSIEGLSDEQAAALIGEDGIDILVDLAGHTAGNRLLVFARRPAPVQVTWLGYPNTTGLDSIDYRLTDALADPPGSTEHLHSEELYRLPGCAWCFAPGTSPPLPRRQEGPITFGCFNNFAKITDVMLGLWGRILLAVPESRLLLKSTGLGSTSARQRVREKLEESGIAPGRLDLRGYEPAYAGHLGLYERMDIALDTFPYHGTTTTCEALWMGVPTVILTGNSHVSRVGVSLLGNVRLPELVASSQEEYVRIAVELAGDLPRLAQLRSTLRERMAASALMDAPRFARDIEAAYREMWRTWCADKSSIPIS